MGSGTHDAGWSLGVLCTVEDKAAQVTELRRVVSGGGAVGFLVFVRTVEKLIDPPEGNHFVTADELEQLVTRPTAFSATYAGDDSFDPAEDETKPVEVKADLRTEMLRSRGRAGRYHLYLVGERATLQATPLPKGFPRRCVTARVQFLVRGKWGYDGKTPCLTPDRRSRVRGYVTGSPQLAGGPLRMRAEFRGDEVHARTTSSWSLVKFRR